MNGQEIPGFYYDPDRNKYFKIQSASASRDLNLKYSAQNIRKKDRQDRLQNKAASHVEKTRKQRVVRKTASNITQMTIDREIGFRRRAFVLHNLWPSACMSGCLIRPKKVVHGPSLRHFDRDPASHTLYAVQGDNSVKRRRIDIKDGPPLPSQDLDTENYFEDMALNSYSFQPWEELQRTTSAISSLTYLPATGALATTTYGSDSPPVVYLNDPDRDGPYVGEQFTPKNCHTIWGVAARPTSFAKSPTLTDSIAASHIEHLAVAASSSMLLFTRSQSGSWDTKSVIQSLNSDILALDWISYTTVALGCRDGKIHLYDTRSGGSSHILTHPHPVVKIKRADDQTRLVVSGLQDSLFLFDIRASRLHVSGREHHFNYAYFQDIHAGKSRIKRRKTKHDASMKFSQPILSFPHANLDDLELDIDVHPQLGLIAAAQDNETNVAIRVSNMWTGKVMREFYRDSNAGGYGNARKNAERMRCVKFMTENESGGVSLWANWGGGIARFEW